MAAYWKWKRLVEGQLTLEYDIKYYRLSKAYDSELFKRERRLYCKRK